MGFKAKFVWAVLDFLERIPMSLTYDIIAIIFLSIMYIGLFWIILRNDAVPPTGHAISDVTAVMDDAQTYINYIIREIHRLGIHISEMTYDDLTQASDADILAHLPERCAHFETSTEVIFAFIDVANARKLCPAIRYVEPIDWVRDSLQWVINYQDYTTSCGITRLAEVCTYAGIGYIIHDLGLTLLIFLFLLSQKQLDDMHMAFTPIYDKMQVSGELVENHPIFMTLAGRIDIINKYQLNRNLYVNDVRPQIQWSEFNASLMFYLLPVQKEIPMSS